MLEVKGHPRVPAQPPLASHGIFHGILCVFESNTLMCKVILRLTTIEWE